jgi:hypothetical protein
MDPTSTNNSSFDVLIERFRYAACQRARRGLLLQIDVWPDHRAVAPSLKAGARSDLSPKIGQQRVWRSDATALRSTCVRCNRNVSVCGAWPSITPLRKRRFADTRTEAVGSSKPSATTALRRTSVTSRRKSRRGIGSFTNLRRSSRPERARSLDQTNRSVISCMARAKAVCTAEELRDKLATGSSIIVKRANSRTSAPRRKASCANMRIGLPPGIEVLS